MSVLPADPKANYLAHKDEIDRAVARVLSGGAYILGEEVAAFERAFAAYIGARESIGTASGTDALHLALRTCGIGPGDEVITVSHTAVATIAAIELAGATPVLVDIDPATFTIDPAQVEAALTPRTKAVVPVHLYGHPADLERLCSIAHKHRLQVIEDCAQSHGALYKARKTGAWGQMAAFSFYPTKNLGAMGDAGAVVTDDPELAARARLLREYGWRERYVSEQPGLNTRLDALQAAILGVKLRFLDAENRRRQEHAALYDQLLAHAPLERPVVRPECSHVYHQYVIRHERRDALREALRAKEIQTLIHYPVPVHLQPAYAGRLRTHGDLPNTRRAAASILSLPLYPELPVEQVRRVAEAIQ